jgi:hypothetical protein
MPSNVLVSGAINLPAINGIYEVGPAYNGKNSYVLNDGVNILSFQYFNNSNVTWILGSIQGIYGLGDLFVTQSDVEYPWLATTWIPEGDLDDIVVTEVPISSQPTFGLPAETVALITSRFGTVANFLRLRNQGQV